MGTFLLVDDSRAEGSGESGDIVGLEEFLEAAEETGCGFGLLEDPIREESFLLEDCEAMMSHTCNRNDKEQKIHK